jgi:hypothetical protein
LLQVCRLRKHVICGPAGALEIMNDHHELHLDIVRFEVVSASQLTPKNVYLALMWAPDPGQSIARLD